MGEEETGRETDLVVEIVVICSGPEGNNLIERPREIVSRVSVDSLKQS